MKAKCDFCKREQSYKDGKFHPPGWDSFCWDDVMQEMCDQCLAKLAEFIKSLGSARV